jgi:hypothetical protein
MTSCNYPINHCPVNPKSKCIAIKERTKVLWGFKTPETAKLILAGFLIHYNYFRPHLALNKMTPAEYTSIKVPVKNWTELVRKVGF